MHEDEGLGKQIRTRDYPNLVQEIDNQIKKDGWKVLNEKLIELRKRTHPSHFVDWKFHSFHRDSKDAIPEEVLQKKPGLVANYTWAIRSGTFRDALAIILDVSTGLDIQHLEITNSLQAESLDDLRNQTLEIVANAFDTQISKNNTFFIDTEEMLSSSYANKVPEIIESRIEEIQALPKKPKLRDVIKTYYGFEMLTIGSTHSTEIGATDTALETVSEFLDGLGISKPKGVRVPNDSNIFSHCEKSTAELLVRIIEMTTGGKDTQIRGGEMLGHSGDSRVTRYLIANLESEKEQYSVRDRYRSKSHLAKLQKTLLHALESIGDPIAFEPILEIFQTDKKPDVIESLSGIRHPQVINKLLEIINEEDKRYATSAFGVLWRSRDDKVLELLRKKLREKPISVGREVIRSLVLFGENGHQILKEEVVFVVKALEGKSSPWKIIDMLKCVKNIFNNTEIKESIAKHIENPRKFSGTRKAISRIEDLPNHPRMIMAYAKAIDSGVSLTEILSYVSHLVNENESLSNALTYRTDEMLRITENPNYGNRIIFRSLMSLNCFFNQEKVRDSLISLLLNEEKWKTWRYSSHRIPLLTLLMTRKETAMDSRLRHHIASGIQDKDDRDSKVFGALEYVPELLEIDEIYDACLKWPENAMSPLRRFDKIKKLPKLLEDDKFMRVYVPRLLESAQRWPADLGREVKKHPTLLEIQELKDLFDDFVEKRILLKCPNCGLFVENRKSDTHCSACQKRWQVS